MGISTLTKDGDADPWKRLPAAMMLLGLCMGWVCVFPVNAAEVEADVFINFEEFPVDTYIQEQYSPKHIHFLSDSLNAGTFRAAPRIVAQAQAKSPSRVMVNSYSEWELFNSHNASLVFWFDKPVSGVGMWLTSAPDPIHGTACDTSIPATVSAYSCNGALSGEVKVNVSSVSVTPVEIDDADGISLVIVDNGESLCPEAIDDLAFNFATGTCTDPTHPQVVITSPIDSRYQDRATVNDKHQTIRGQVFTDGILASVKVNGVSAPYYLNSSQSDPVFGRIYDFTGDITLHEGGNYITALAKNPFGATGSDHITLDLATPTSATLDQFHLTQRGVMQDTSCDVDGPLVAGKSALIRIDLDVRDANGGPTYTSQVEMTVGRKDASGKESPVGTLWGWIYSPVVGVFNTPSDMASIHFWVPGDLLDLPGTYTFTFQPYAGLYPIGGSLTPPCGSDEYLFANTRSLELMVLPVEAGIYSPLLENHSEFAARQIHVLLRTFPIRDSQNGLILTELSPFRLCDGTANSVTANPVYCQGTGFNWTFVKRGTGFQLLRTDAVPVVNVSIDACGPDDHQIGGRVKSGTTYSYADIPDLGIFLAGAHPSWEGAKYAVPLDSNHDGSIDKTDLAHYIAEFYDNQTNQWMTDLNEYDSGETFRFFVDEDHDNCNDRFDDPQADIRQVWENEQTIINDGPAQDARNAYCDDHSCTRFPLFSFWFPDEFVPKDSRFGDIGPGQGRNPGSLSWIKIRNASALPHELGHNVGGLEDLYLAGTDPAEDDMVTKENAWATYIDTESVPPSEVFAVMGLDRNPDRVMHYQPHYQRLFNNLTLPTSLSLKAAVMETSSDQFVATGWINIDTQDLDLHTSLRSGLPLTEADHTSDYALVFGNDTFELDTFTFPVQDLQSPVEGAPEYPVSIIPLNIVTPLPVDTEWVEIRYKGTALYRITRSVQLPSVSLIYPHGGESLGTTNPVTVEWASSDPDGGALLHTLYYSPDLGDTWRVVAAGLGGTTYDWDLTTAPGTTGDGGLLRIEASDGFNTAEDQSGSFSVTGKPPIAVILEPHSGRTYLECQRIMLTGTALDPDGGAIQYTWAIDGQPTGEGERIGVVPLPYGDHEITLTVRDEQSHSSLDSIVITVLADSDCDGMSNQFEDRYGLDPGWAEDAAEDEDGDSLINFEEAYYATNPHNPDTDGDGIPDGSDTQPVNPAQQPPQADANGPYVGYEGTPLTLDAGGSTDPEGDPLAYRWDLNGDGTWDTAWSMEAPREVTWCDDYSGAISVQVRDSQGLLSEDSAMVTVHNVAPSVSLDSPEQPNPQFILPLVHTLTFQSTIQDPGCDSWVVDWDFDGDGLTDSTDPIPNHIYAEPGTYKVTVTVTDDDGGTGSDWREVMVMNETEAKHDLAAYIEALPDGVFRGKAEQRKLALAHVLDALDGMIAEKEWNGFITSLQSNVRAKADGTVDGKAGDDWITTEIVQQHICGKIDDIVAYVRTFPKEMEETSSPLSS